MVAQAIEVCRRSREQSQNHGNNKFWRVDPPKVRRGQAERAAVPTGPSPRPLRVRSETVAAGVVCEHAGMLNSRTGPQFALTSFPHHRNIAQLALVLRKFLLHFG